MRLRFREAWSFLTLNANCVNKYMKKKKKNLGKAYITYIRFELGKKKRVKNFNMKHLSIEQ